MKQIQLTQGKTALVNDEDYDYLMQWKWSARQSKLTLAWYAIRNSSTVNGKRTTILMHRAILGLTDPKIFGDHKDHDGLNNQRSNIRIATRSENTKNSTSRKGSKSKYLGVLYCTTKAVKNKWYAMIKVNGEYIRLGHYMREEDAARAYDRAAIKYHGEFANPNFKQE